MPLSVIRWYVLIFILAGCSQGPVYQAEADTNLLEEYEDEAVLRYGLPVDDYLLIEGSVRPGQVIADILLNHDVPYNYIVELERVADSVFSVRKLKAGFNYTLFCKPDTTRRAQYMVVETSRENYVVYCMADSIKAYTGKKPVHIELREASGMIHHSLSKSLSESGHPLELTQKLSEVYAWTVDFFRLQKGDRFRLIYEEKIVEGEVAGIRNIIAAEFEHRGNPISAFRFSLPEGEEYFDSAGESLRRAFLKAPLEYSRISSQYSLKRFHPVQKRWKAHLGTDYAAPTGTPIVATADGEVVASEYGKYNGNFVKIRHNSMYSTQYLHMSKRTVKKGERVRQGQVIGHVGATGLASGPHVCYRFWKNGRQVDPLREELPRSEPVPLDLKSDFEELRNNLTKRLQSISWDFENMDGESNELASDRPE